MYYIYYTPFTVSKTLGTTYRSSTQNTALGIIA